MNHSAQTTDRQIRVFISSTFRDMQAERDILIKKIFPQLRKLCDERAVTWTEVDLRWGITTEQAAEGKVLPLCLEEIHRCRPYFIGLLGERYGWVPERNSIPAELLDSQPWLKQHLAHSVTELEILHGVFSEESMHGHAYFYFRDPRYVESIPTEKRQDFTAESADAAGKLEKLKQKIRSARDEQVCELRENYATPEQLGEWILEDFTKLIDRLYPKDQTPDPIDQEAARHEAYARSRRLAFVGREDLLQSLAKHCAIPGKSIVLTGESGCGKSALLAEWLSRWRKDHPDDLIIQHYIGSTPDSADWQGLVRRILSELKRAFAITDEIPVQPDALRGALNDWTVKAAGSRRVVLVLDALNQLAEDGAARQLGWLPVAFPANFRLLVSSLPGESLDALRKRGWPELNVPLFARADIAPAALAYFRIFSKTPPPDLVAKLEFTPAACNALYLRAVLDELRQFGIYETLQAKAADYLSAPDLPDLFDRILTRWHDDFGKDPEHLDLVRRSLCLIACARFGLAEGELLDLLGKNGEPMPRRRWTPCYLAAENALVLRAGLLNFGHDYVRAAVGKRWLESAESVRASRLQLVEYFSKTPQPTNRILDELPTLLRDLAEWARLKQVLEDPLVFMRLRSSERWKWELNGFWVHLRKRYDAGEVYRSALAFYESLATDRLPLSDLLSNIAVFHFEASDYKSAEPLFRRSLAIDEERYGPDHPELAADLNNLAELLLATNRNDEAEPLVRRSLAIYERSHGASHPSVSPVLSTLAKLLMFSGRRAEAEALMRRALAIDEQNVGSDIGRSLNNLAEVLKETSRWADAEVLLRRSLAVDENRYGPDHPEVAVRLNNLAQLLKQTNRRADAEPMLRRSLSIAERNFGVDHPTFGIYLTSLAGLLQDSPQSTEVEALYRRALAIAELNFEPGSPKIANQLSDLAQFLHATNRPSEAEPLMRRALEYLEQHKGANPADVARCLNNLAMLLNSTNRPVEAESLMMQALTIDEGVFGPHHPDVGRDLYNLALLLIETGRPVEAEPMLRRALANHEQNTAPDDPRIASCVGALGKLLYATKRLADAEPFMRRALLINERVLGQDHPSVVQDMNNLAMLLWARGRLKDAEPILRKVVESLLQTGIESGKPHPHLQAIVGNYGQLLSRMGRSGPEVIAQLNTVGRPFGFLFGE